MPNKKTGKPNPWLLKFVHGYPGWFVPLMVERGEAKTEAQAVKLLSLIEAIEHNDVKLIKKLVPSTFDSNLVFDEDTLLEHAVVRGQIDSVRALLQAGADVKKCTLGGDVETNALLLEHGADPNARVGGYTPLGGACMAGDEAMVALLIRASANPNAGNSIHLNNKHEVKNCTPLMLAAWRGHLTVAGMLLSAGANPAKKDSEGQTALDWARRRKGRKADPMIDLLEGASR